MRGRLRVRTDSKTSLPAAAGTHGVVVLTRTVILLCVLAALVIFVVDMSGSGPHTTGSSGVYPNASVVGGGNGAPVCQPDLTLPTGTGAIRVYIWSQDTLPAVRATFTSRDGTVLAGGTHPAGSPPGAIFVPLRPRAGATGQRVGSLCLSTPSAQALPFSAGTVVAGAHPATLAGKAQGTELYLIYESGTSASWWQMLPKLMPRFGYGKWSLLGSWTFILAILAVVAIWVAAIRLLWREFS